MPLMSFNLTTLADAAMTLLGVPLVGAFFVDIANAFVLQGFLHWRGGRQRQPQMAYAPRNTRCTPSRFPSAMPFPCWENAV